MLNSFFMLYNKHMYYRYVIEKENKQSGLFHPLDEWNVPKENGLYDVVCPNFESLTYKKNKKVTTVSWFTEEGKKNYSKGIQTLKEFYEKFGIEVKEIQSENPGIIVQEDDMQIWVE